ncbi:hypothetical protein HK405_012939, partial [Cladochytrium tenue]
MVTRQAITNPNIVFTATAATACVLAVAVLLHSRRHRRQSHERGSSRLSSRSADSIDPALRKKRPRRRTHVPAVADGDLPREDDDSLLLSTDTDPDTLRRVARAEREARIRAQIALASALARIRLITGGDGVGAADVHDDAHQTDPTGAVATPNGSAASSPQPLHVPLAVIGTVSSCFSTRNGTPRQPSLATEARAVLRLRPGVPAAALRDLDQFSHCWVLFLFHQNTNAHKAGPAAASSAAAAPAVSFKASVVPPRLGSPTGVLATRSPHRPAPVGLSLARIVSVDTTAGSVLFSGLDLVDGTPVFDIKPYVPFADAPCTPAELARWRRAADATGPFAGELSDASQPALQPDNDDHVRAPGWVARESADGPEPLAIAAV